MEIRTILGAYAFAVLLVLAALWWSDPAFGADRCGTTTLDERISAIETLEDRGIPYRIALSRHSDAVTHLNLITREGPNYIGVRITFLRGCQMPLPPSVIDAGSAARKYFGKTLAELFPTDI